MVVNRNLVGSCLEYRVGGGVGEMLIVCVCVVRNGGGGSVSRWWGGWGGCGGGAIESNIEITEIYN